MYRRARSAAGTDLQPWGLTTTPAIASPSGYVRPGRHPHRPEELDHPGVRPDVRRENAAGRGALRRPGPDHHLGGCGRGRPGTRRPTGTSRRAAADPQRGRRAGCSTRRPSAAGGGAAPAVEPGQHHRLLRRPRRRLARTSPRSTTSTSPRVTVTENGGLDYPDAARSAASSTPRTSPRPGAGRHSVTTLQNVLARNDTVDGEVVDRVLNSLSYASRERPAVRRAPTPTGLARWISGQLASIEVEAPRAVTLASTSGRFAATVTNRLDHPVTVRVAVATPSAPHHRGHRDDRPRRRMAAPRSSSRRRTDRLGVHNVSCVVTDEDGTPLGSSDDAADPLGPGEPGDLADPRHRRRAAVRRDRRTPRPAGTSGTRARA